MNGLMAWLRRMDAALSGKGGNGTGREAALSGDPAGLPGRIRRGLAFGPAARAETWQLLADVTEAGVEIGGAVETVMGTCRRSGRTGRALVLAEMKAGISAGNVGARLAPYVSGPERLLLEGLARQRADRILGGAARLLRNRMALRKALREAVAMPVLLAFGLLALVLFFGLELLPAFAELVNFDTLPPLQAAVVGVTLAISEDPLALAIWLGGIAAALFLLMRYWTGRDGRSRTGSRRFPCRGCRRGRASSSR